MLTIEIELVLGIIGLAVILFVTEIVRIDVAALLIMLLIGLVNQLPGIDPLIDPELLFSGFSSNAVLSIIAIMIISSGLDKSGVMTKIANFLLNLGWQTERRMVARITIAIGMISGFMQNVGATALFLPVVSRIANRTGIPLSKLLIPTGFCAILGGTLTMVGCSSLIILNDLIILSSATVSNNASTIQTFSLFDVTPVGLALLSTGIVFFSLLGKVLLPSIGKKQGDTVNPKTYLKKIYGIQAVIYDTIVPQNSIIAGKTIRQIENADTAPHILSLSSQKETQMSPNRDDIVWPGSKLLLLGHNEEIRRFAEQNQLSLTEVSAKELHLKSEVSGISEVVIPPGSNLIGLSVGQIRLRRHYNVVLLGVHRNAATIEDNLRSLTLKPGDTLILYSRWKDLAGLAKNKSFIVASDYPKEILRPEKLTHALICFTIAMGLILFTDFKLSFALLLGTAGMLLCGVITMDEAYQAVSWKTVFLLAGLIPLGIAAHQTGTASWIAFQILSLLDGAPVWSMQMAIAILATGLTLVMSNVGTTVLLVPVAMSLALELGANPSVFALTVALATSNSFVIPTHQVNALIMGPAGYKVNDFTRVGGIMTVLYLLVLIPMLNLVF